METHLTRKILSYFPGIEPKSKLSGSTRRRRLQFSQLSLKHIA
jgi:hypothetical protein